MSDGRWSGRVLLRGLWISILVVPVVCATASAATLPAGSFVFDGNVGSIVRDGTDVIVGGDFTQEQTPTGGGLVLSQSGSGDPDPSRFPKVDGDVEAVAADGSGGWFIGGGFTHVGGQAHDGLAHILADGTLDPGWDPDLDASTIRAGRVDTLAVSGSTVYVGGDFSTIGGQSRRDLAALDATTGTATAWNPNPDGRIFALVAAGDTVYATGAFTSIGGQSRSYLAALDATTGDATSWNPNPESFVNAIAVSGSTVYAGGEFSSIGGQSRSGLAALDALTGNATAWNPNPDGEVVALATSGSTVYAGGDFSSIGGQTRNYLAALDATTGHATAWDPEPDDSVDDLAAAGSTVFAGGLFSTIGGQSRNDVAELDAATGDATAWNPNPGNPTPADLDPAHPTPSFSSSIAVLTVSGSTVYVGGTFAGAGPALATVGGLAKLDAAGDLDTSWRPDPSTTGWEADSLGGFEPRITTSAVIGSTVYVGGDFDSIDGQPRDGLAALDSATGDVKAWNPSHDGGVSLLTASGSTIYAAGNFSTIDGQPRNGLAALDATTGIATAWNPDAPDYTLGGQMRALVVSGSTVYAVGGFDSIGGQPRDGLAALDAVTGRTLAWSPNTGGSEFFAAAASESTLYAAGYVQTADGSSRPGIAAFDATTAVPTAWNPIPNDEVFTLAASGSTVYVGGEFSSIDGAVTGPFAVLTADLTPAPDTTAPTITITTPQDDQHFAQGATVASAFSCDDGSGGSGVQSCSGPATVATATVGAGHFTVTATDNAGNTTTTTVDYVVDAPSGMTMAPLSTPPPAIAAPPPPAPADTKAPAASLTGSTTQELAKVVAVGVSCADEACTARTTASIRVPRVGSHKAKTYKLKAVTTHIARGRKATVKLALSSPVRAAIGRALRAHKRVSVSITTTISDAAGNKRKLSRAVKLRR